jgi:hypothetical protein
MPLEDLDLEFEDEEEQKRKRKESLHDAVDLEFGATPEKTSSNVAQVRPGAAAPHPAIKQGNPQVSVGQNAQVKKIEEVRAKIAQSQNPNKAANPAAAGATPARPIVQGANALQLAPDPSSDDATVAGLYQQLEQTKFEARVQVAVAQEKGEFMAEVLSDAKLLQHQVQQLLTRINQKNPELKPELMAIQKALADFLAKKRK